MPEIVIPPVEPFINFFGFDNNYLKITLNVIPAGLAFQFYVSSIVQPNFVQTARQASKDAHMRLLKHTL